MLGRSVAVLVSLLVIGCTQDPYANLAKPRAFFERERVGSAQDYALIKWGDPEDHVATAHGFADDGEGCRLMAEGLNRDACEETGGRDCRNPFSCIPIVPGH